MRFVAYLRVSTDQQADSGQGLDIQEDACRAWARKHRHRLVDVVRDLGVSGTTDVAARPGLSRVMALLAAEKADGIVVFRLDRLARDLVLQETFLDDLHRRGRELHSCSPTEDAHLENAEDDPSRALVRQILGSVAQYERAMTRLRLRAGRDRKRAAGGYAAGPPPYGFAAVKGDLVPVPAEQSAIRLMRKLHGDGQSYRQIGEELTRRGIRSRAAHGKWRPGTIWDILRREDMRRGIVRARADRSPDLAEVSA